MHLLHCPPAHLIPGIAEPNIRSAETVVGSHPLRAQRNDSALSRRHLVLPDTVGSRLHARLRFLPSRAAEALPVLRFRLRKMVPFDVEHAGVSYQVLSRARPQSRLLTAILPGPVLAEYEAAVRAAGYEPGAVLPSSLAALEVVDSMEAVLAANLSPLALTTSITNGSDLLLHRTLDLPEDPDERLAEIQRGIAVAAAYYEDKLRAPARKFTTRAFTTAASSQIGSAAWN